MYGYPFLSESRKPTRAQAERLNRVFKDARFAFNDKQHSWEIVQPVSLVDRKTGLRQTRWSRVMRLGREITEADFVHLSRVRQIHAGAEKVEEQNKEDVAADRDADREKDDRLEEMARRLYRIVPAIHGIPTATSVSMHQPRALTARRTTKGARPTPVGTPGFKRSSSGLLVPTSVGG